MRLILIHGAWAGPWVWDQFVEAWGGRTPVEVVDVQSAPDETDAEQITAILAAIDGSAEPAVLVGHSGGATLALTAAHLRRDKITALVSLAGITLRPGGDLVASIEALGLGDLDPIFEFLQYTDAGSVVPPEAAVACFFQDLEPRLAVAASRRMVPVPEKALSHPPQWDESTVGTLPHLYVAATEDRCLPLLLQRDLAQQGSVTKLVELDCGHAVPVAAAEQVAALIEEFLPA